MATESQIRDARHRMERAIREHGEKTGQRVTTRDAERKASEIARRHDRRASERK